MVLKSSVVTIHSRLRGYDFMTEKFKSIQTDLLSQFDKIEEWDELERFALNTADACSDDFEFRDQLAAMAEEKFQNGRKLIFDIYHSVQEKKVEGKTRAFFKNPETQPGIEILKTANSASSQSSQIALSSKHQRNAPALREPSTKPIELDPTAPLDWAKIFARLNYWANETKTLRCHQGQFYRWSGKHYDEVDEKTLEA